MASQIKPPRHLLVGQPSVLPLGERSIREQVESYLSRMRYTLPLPIPSYACYFGCLPPEMKQWEKDGYFRHNTTPSRAGNMLLTMHQTSDRANRLRNILHISAENSEEYRSAMDGGRGHEKLFWIEVGMSHPTPRNSTSNPFFLPADHDYYTEIMRWVDAAYGIENEIDESIKLIEGFNLVVQTPNVAAKVWPELVNFINFKKGAANNVSQAVRDRALKALPQTDRDRILYQLSRAVMLPERKGPLAAWVKFYSHEVAK